MNESHVRTHLQYACIVSRIVQKRYHRYRSSLNNESFVTRCAYIFYYYYYLFKIFFIIKNGFLVAV